MARCRCEDIDRCNKQINVLDKQNRKRDSLFNDIDRMLELYDDIIPARKECYLNINRGKLEKSNLLQKKGPEKVFYSAGNHIDVKRTDIENELNGMTEEDREFHEEEERNRLKLPLERLI